MVGALVPFLQGPPKTPGPSRRHALPQPDTLPTRALVDFTTVVGSRKIVAAEKAGRFHSASCCVLFNFPETIRYDP